MAQVVGPTGRHGGVLELDETIPDGLAREVHEEAGLHIRPIALTGVYKNMRRAIIALVFRCEITGATTRTSDEAPELAWLTPDELHSHMNDAYRLRLLDALNDPPATVRAHDGTSIVS